MDAEQRRAVLAIILGLMNVAICNEFHAQCGNCTGVQSRHCRLVGDSFAFLCYKDLGGSRAEFYRGKEIFRSSDGYSGDGTFEVSPDSYNQHMRNLTENETAEYWCKTPRPTTTGICYNERCWCLHVVQTSQELLDCRKSITPSLIHPASHYQSNDLEVEVGNDAVFQCAHTGVERFAQVYWKLDGKALPINGNQFTSRVVITGVDLTVLRLQSVRFADGGLVTCELYSNDNGNLHFADNMTYNFLVVPRKDSPYTSLARPMVNATLGDPTTIICPLVYSSPRVNTALSLPKPTDPGFKDVDPQFLWYMGTKVIANSGRYAVTDISLTIIGAGYEDSSTYRCCGRDTKQCASVHLSVEGQPATPRVDIDVNYGLIYHHDPSPGKTSPEVESYKITIEKITPWKTTTYYHHVFPPFRVFNLRTRNLEHCASSSSRPQLSIVVQARNSHGTSAESDAMVIAAPNSTMYVTMVWAWITPMSCKNIPRLDYAAHAVKDEFMDRFRNVKAVHCPLELLEKVFLNAKTSRNVSRRFPCAEDDLLYTTEVGVLLLTPAKALYDWHKLLVSLEGLPSSYVEVWSVEKLCILSDYDGREVCIERGQDNISPQDRWAEMTNETEIAPRPTSSPVQSSGVRKSQPWAIEIVSVFSGVALLSFT